MLENRPKLKKLSSSKPTLQRLNEEELAHTRAGIASFVVGPVAVVVAGVGAGVGAGVVAGAVVAVRVYPRSQTVDMNLYRNDGSNLV